MVYPCWLCPSEFLKKQELKTHISLIPHRRLTVICPWCRDYVVTQSRMSCLKIHAVRSHPPDLASLPDDFFSEANGYYMSVYPIDYQRIIKPADPSLETTKLTIELITKLNEVMPRPPKTMEEWRAQWEMAKETEQQPLMEFDTPTSYSASQAASSNTIVLMTIHERGVGEKYVSEATPVKTIDSAGGKSLARPLMHIDPRLNASQNISDVTPIDTVTSSTGQSMAVSHVPPTVLTPPGTPTPIPIAASSSQITSVPTTHEPKLVQGSGRQTERTSANVDPNMYPFCCLICGLRFKEKHNLRNHNWVHAEEKPFQCSQCGKEYTHRRTFDTHMKTAHGDKKSEPRKKRHTCHICKRHFYIRDKLRIHALSCRVSAPSLNKANERLYQCGECGSTFKKKNALDIHRHVHINSQFRCPICTKLFPRIRFLKCHVVKGHGTDLMTLAQSGNTKAQLLMKVKENVPRPFKCELCGKRFEKFEHRKFHMKTHGQHSGNKKSRSSIPLFACKHCDASFNEEYLLAKHLLNDHPTEELTASISDINNVQANSMDTNTSLANTEGLLRSKPGAKTSDRKAKFKQGTTAWSRNEYKCDICGTKFYHRQSLIHHIKTHLEDSDTDNRTQAMVVVNCLEPEDETDKTINKLPYRHRPGYTKMGVARRDVRNESLGEEVKENENETTKYRCKVCLATFNSHIGLMEHITLKADYHCEHFTKKLSDLIYNNLPTSRMGVYKRCEICGLFYTNRHSMLSHTLKHSKNSSKTASDPKTKMNNGDVNPTENTDLTLEENMVLSDLQNGSETIETLELNHANTKSIDPRIEIIRDDKEPDIVSDSEMNIQIQNIQILQNGEEIATCHAEDLTSVNQQGSSKDVFFEQESEGKSNEFVYVFDTVEVESHDLESEGEHPCSASETLECVKEDAQSNLLGCSSMGESLGLPCSSLDTREPSSINLELDSTPSLNDSSKSKVSQFGTGVLESVASENSAIQPSNSSYENTRQNPDNSKADIKNIENINAIESEISGNHMSTATVTPSNILKEQGENKTNFNVIDLDESCNDYNSSDEDILFGENIVSRDKGTQQDLPMGTNKECIQCQIPFVERHVTITCSLCCKRFCRRCSQIPRKVYREAFRGPSVGLVWMCKVCKPALPTYMTLLHQLAQFEDLVNTRLTNISKRLLTTEQNRIGGDNSGGLQ